MDMMKAAGKAMGAHNDKPAKKVKSIEIKKAASGGHIITHHHTRPDAHPSEDHVTSSNKAMMQHVSDAMGSGAAPGGAMGAGAPDPAAAAGAPGGTGAVPGATSDPTAAM